MNTEQPTGRQAYSYVRFSSPEQASGDSLRRQTELAGAYAKECGLQLNTATFRDLGISAFAGSNRTEGALSAFIRACRTGRVPKGSALLVESLDRLSREQVRKALRLLLELIDDYEIEIHTLGDRHVYGRGTDTTDLVLSLIIMSRAHEESERKSQRVGAAWRNKKAQAAAQPGVAITAKAPAWIHAVKGEPMSLITDRARVIRKIFKLSLDGLGSQLIAQYLNKHYPTWSKSGNGWHKSYVEKIINNPATYGVYVPHKRVGKNKRIYDGDPIFGFFPNVIDFATFQKVQQARDSRYRERKGSTTATMRNLFAGLITDKDYNLPMVYYWRGNELVTDSYRMKKKPHRFDYSRFERWFLTFLDQLDWTTILDVAESEDLKHAEEEIGKLSLDIERGEQQAQKLTDMLLDTPSRTLKDRLLKTEAQVEKNKADKAAAEKRLDELKRKHSDLLDKSVIYTKLAKSSDIETRARLREEIRRKVSRIEFAFHKPVLGGDDTIVAVTFVNGTMMALVFCENGTVLTGDLDNPFTWLIISGDKSRAQGSRNQRADEGNLGSNAVSTLLNERRRSKRLTPFSLAFRPEKFLFS
jgi:DNA invertase Pin-like site-specific DNA recombinase